jgi:hypothetical protein
MGGVGGEAEEELVGKSRGYVNSMTLYFVCKDVRNI